MTAKTFLLLLLMMGAPHAWGKGGSESSGGGHGFLSTIRAFKRRNAPRLPNGRLYLAFGIDPNSKRRKVTLYDFFDQADTSAYIYSVLPYRALHWNDPSAKDARLLKVCRSLGFPVEGPHCWSLINKVAQIRIAEPLFAEFLLDGMGFFDWKLSDAPPAISDWGPTDARALPHLLQLARRDGRSIRVSRFALHDGWNDIDPLGYADFVGLILHEVIYGKISPAYETSEGVRTLIARLFYYRCPAVGRAKSLTRGAEVAWLCQAAEFPTREYQAYESISRVWYLVRSMAAGTRDFPKTVKPQIYSIKNRDAVLKDLTRFALLHSSLIGYFRSEDTFDFKILGSIEAELPRSKQAPDFYFRDAVAWLVMANALSENILGSTLFIPSGFDSMNLRELAEALNQSVEARDDYDFNRPKK